MGGYIGLCYHYVRTGKEDKRFSRIIGNTEDQFRAHIEMIKGRYEVMAPEDAIDFSYGKYSPANGKTGVLITFDDGLSDHYGAARILYEYGLKGLFFISTTVLKDRLPANSTIIHYCLAGWGVRKFLEAYYSALEKYGLDSEKYKVTFKKGEDPWKAIYAIKTTFKYRLGREKTRAALLYIYERLFGAEHKEAVDIIHLNEGQVRGMLDMGHSVGVHSHSHISVAGTGITDRDFMEEMIEPKRYLEETFKTPVLTLSYPFGEKKDCLSSAALLEKTEEYRLAFTIEPVVNTKETHPLELGRYQITSRDDETKLKGIMEEIARGKEIAI